MQACHAVCYVPVQCYLGQLCGCCDSTCCCEGHPFSSCQPVSQGLNLFKGGVLMVSHDQFLIESTVDELWAVEGGRITPFHGTFQEYKRRLRDQAKK